MTIIVKDVQKRLSQKVQKAIEKASQGRIKTIHRGGSNDWELNDDEIVRLALYEIVKRFGGSELDISEPVGDRSQTGGMFQ